MLPSVTDPSIVPSNLIALISVGMGLAFWLADPRSRSSRWFALCLATIGAGVFFSASLLENGIFPDYSLLWSAIGGMLDGAAVFAGAAWLLAVRRTIPAGQLDTRGGDMLLRLAQILAGFYALLSAALPHWRAGSFLQGAAGFDALPSIRFFAFAIPLELALGAVVFATLLTLNRKPERSEATRMLAFAIAAPIIACGLVIPDRWAAYTSMLGLIIILIGSVRFHVMQGRKGAFMGRFLSPDVANLVRNKGLRAGLTNETREISVVSIDIRGYTAFAESCPSEDVISGLQDYYTAVGEIAAQYKATIKDYAGDGVLMLVGAPLACDDHAPRAVALANDLVDRISRLLVSWSNDGKPLGVGVGVSTGPATIGVVGGTRLEYAAVGSVVNRAARLCDQARSGEVLVDQATYDALHEDQRRQHASSKRMLSLKGIQEPVPAYLTAAFGGLAVGATIATAVE